MINNGVRGQPQCTGIPGDFRPRTPTLHDLSPHPRVTVLPENAMYLLQSRAKDPGKLSGATSTGKKDTSYYTCRTIPTRGPWPNACCTTTAFTPSGTHSPG